MGVRLCEGQNFEIQLYENIVIEQPIEKKKSK